MFLKRHGRAFSTYLKNYEKYHQVSPRSLSVLLDRVESERNLTAVSFGRAMIFDMMHRDVLDLSDMHLASSDAEKIGLRATVFNDIVALCRERILSRMRSSKYKATGYKKQRCFIGLLLRDASKSLGRQRASKHNLNMTEQELESHSRRIESLLEAMERFEASNTMLHQSQPDLVTLVREVAHFKQHTPLRDLLDTLTNEEMHEESRQRLVSCLNKIARYYEIAKYLCREAETVPLLRNATVKSLELPADAFARPQGKAYHGTLASILDRLSTSKRSIRVHVLPPWLQETLRAISDEDFASSISQNLEESKIHAEIQILSHFENAAATLLRPRVIASSKDACYLCHAIFSLHRQYLVPKTHGRLYSCWRLPAMQILEGLQQRLNTFLEDKIKRTVGGLRERGGFPAVRFSNESTLFSLTVSASPLSYGSKLSIVSDQPLLDPTTTAPVAYAPNQVDVEAPKARDPGAPLQPIPSAGTADIGGPGPCVTDRGSDDEKDSWSVHSTALQSARENESTDIVTRAPHVVHLTMDININFCAPASSAPRVLETSVVSHDADDDALKTVGGCCCS